MILNIMPVSMVCTKSGEKNCLIHRVARERVDVACTCSPDVPCKICKHHDSEQIGNDELSVSYNVVVVSESHLLLQHSILIKEFKRPCSAYGVVLIKPIEKNSLCHTPHFSFRASFRC